VVGINFYFFTEALFRLLKIPIANSIHIAQRKETRQLYHVWVGGANYSVIILIQNFSVSSSKEASSARCCGPTCFIPNAFCSYTRYTLHGPCSRAPVHTTREHGPSTRPGRHFGHGTSIRNLTAEEVLFAVVA